MFDQFDAKVSKTKEHFQTELKSIRTGRAHPSLVAGLGVAAYGGMMPLSQLAAISAPEAKLLLIEPWDKAVIKEIEKAIAASTLNLSPLADGSVIRLKLPDLTQEGRINLLKVLHAKLEQTRVAIRQARDETKKEIENKKRAGELTEDDRFELVEKLDKKTKEAISQLESLAAAKEKEVMTI